MVYILKIHKLKFSTNVKLSFSTKQNEHICLLWTKGNFIYYGFKLVFTKITFLVRKLFFFRHSIPKDGNNSTLQGEGPFKLQNTAIN